MVKRKIAKSEDVQIPIISLESNNIPITVEYAHASQVIEKGEATGAELCQPLSQTLENGNNDIEKSFTSLYCQENLEDQINIIKVTTTTSPAQEHTTDTNVVPQFSSADLSLVSAVENIKHDHNLAKCTQNQKVHYHHPVLPQLIPEATLEQSHIQNIMLTSYIDGKPMSTQPGSQIIQIIPCNSGVKHAWDIPTSAPLMLTSAYQFFNVPQALPSMITSSVLSSNKSDLKNTINNEIEIQASGGTPDMSKDLERNINDSQKIFPHKNPTVIVQSSNGDSIKVQRFYYNKGLCRVCLLEKEDTTSIFDNEKINEKGLIENTRGPHPIRYNIIPALKTLLDIDMVYGDGLPDQICMDCLDNLVSFSVFRRKIAIGQTKFNEVRCQVLFSEHPTFIPPLGETDFRKTDIFKHPESILKAKELMATSTFSHMVQRCIPDRIWDKIFGAMSLVVGIKSEKLKYLEMYSHSAPYATGWFCNICKTMVHDANGGFADHCLETHQIRPENSINKYVKYPCDICGDSFPLENESGVIISFGEHWLRHFFFHECPVCSKKMPSSKGLWSHKKSAHVTREKIHKCDLCDKAFHLKSHLQAHRKTHLDASDRHLVHCHLCGKGLTGSLSSHLSTVHSEERNWSCDICGKAFKKKEALVGHKNTVHLNIKKFQCEICGEYVKTHQTKVLHLLRHKGEKTHTCETCGKKFYTLPALKSHSIKHNLTGHIECPTEGCGKFFKRKIYLVEHMRLHSGEKPFFCEKCGKYFAMKSNYFKHLKVHKRQKEASEAKNVSPSV